MKTTRTRSILTLAAVFVAAGATAFAFGPGGPGGPGGTGGPGGPGGAGGPDLGRFVGHLSMMLDLSADQESQIDAVVTAAQAEADPILTAMADARQAWFDANPLGTFDEAAFRQFAQSQSAQHVELAVIMQRGISQVWNVLTPEQQQQAQAMMDRMHQRMGRGQGTAAGRGHGGKRGGFFGRHANPDCPYNSSN